MNEHHLRTMDFQESSHSSWPAIITTMATPVQAERIKDLAVIQGVRNNQLLGYGLVVGLDGSGDKVNSSPFTQQSLRSMLTQLGIVVPPGVKLNPKNVAAVTVHADLPPFSKPGQQIDVTVSSIGDAKSLRGGSLLMTPLKGIDGQVYASRTGQPGGRRPGGGGCRRFQGHHQYSELRPCSQWRDGGAQCCATPFGAGRHADPEPERG